MNCCGGEHWLSAGEALLALQDGAEMVMRVVGDHLGLPPRYEFLDFWSRMKEKTGTEPPHKAAMDRVNVARVGFKHKGNSPDRTLVSGFQTLVQEFCTDLCDQYLDRLDFEKVTFAILITSDKVRLLVQESESLFEAGSQGKALEKLALAFHQLYSTSQRDAGDLLIWGAKAAGNASGRRRSSKRSRKACRNDEYALGGYRSPRVPLFPHNNAKRLQNG